MRNDRQRMEEYFRGPVLEQVLCREAVPLSGAEREKWLASLTGSRHSGGNDSGGSNTRRICLVISLQQWRSAVSDQETGKPCRVSVAEIH